ETSDVLFYYFQPSRDLHPLHSFPTRRSSDLYSRRHCADRRGLCGRTAARRDDPLFRGRPGRRGLDPGREGAVIDGRPDLPPYRRSEEHTSELQSRENLVCRLLLEKKKKE